MATAIMKQKGIPEMDDVEEIISKISEESPYKRRPTQKRTWMTVPEMGKLLGLKKTDRYWLVHKNVFESKEIAGKIRINILDYVDKKRLQFTVAVDISYIDKEIQTWLFEYIKENGTVKAVQVAALRTALEAGPMTQAKMISILVNSQPGRKQEQKITLSEKKLRNFFSDKYTAEDMESVILELLDQWKRGEITV